MIKAIIFDCFGVLTADLWREFCVSLPPGPQVQKAKQLNAQYDAGTITKEEFVEGVYRATGKEFKHIENLLDTDITKNTALIDYIRSLRDKNYKMSILSNVGTTWIKDKFLSSNERKLFDDILLSFEAGFTKPDPRIFALAAKRLGVDINECVLIDDVESYCLAAKAQGMSAVWYQDFAQMKRELEPLLTNSNN